MLEHHHLRDLHQLGGLAGRADREVRVLGVLGDVLQLGIGRILGGVIHRDAVGRQADLAIQVGLVVGRILPRQGAGHEGGIELLGVFQRGAGLGRVDGDLAVLVHQLAAMRPQQPVCPVVGITDGLAQGEADRGVLGLQGLAQLEEAGRVLGNGIEAGRLDLAFAIDQGIADHAQRQRDPLAVLGAVLAADVVPAAIALAQRIGQIGHVDQLGRVLLRVVEPAQHDVRTAAHVGGHGRLRAYVFPAFAVGTYGHAGQFGEFLDVGVPQVFIALDETLPAQDAQGRALFDGVLDAVGTRRAGACGKGVHAHAGSGCGSSAGDQEFASCQLAHVSYSFG